MLFCSYLSGYRMVVAVIVAQGKHIEAQRRDGISVALKRDVLRGHDYRECTEYLLFHRLLVLFVAYVDGSILQKLRTCGASVRLTESTAIV